MCFEFVFFTEKMCYFSVTVFVIADPRGGALQHPDQHHLLRAVEPQRGGGGGGCGVEREGTGLFCSYKTGLVLPAGSPSWWHQTQVSDEPGLIHAACVMFKTNSHFQLRHFSPFCHILLICRSARQPAGDDAGFLSVGPEGGSGSGPPFLP